MRAVYLFLCLAPFARRSTKLRSEASEHEVSVSVSNRSFSRFSAPTIFARGTLSHGKGVQHANALLYQQDENMLLTTSAECYSAGFGFLRRSRCEKKPLVIRSAAAQGRVQVATVLLPTAVPVR